MTPEDRFAELLGSIPDPIALSSVSAPRPVQPPVAPSPTRSAMKTRRAIAIGALIVWSAFVLLRWGFRPEIADLASFVAGQSAIFGALLFAVGLIAVSAGRRGLGRPILRVRTAVLAVPIAFILVGLTWLPPGSPAAFGEIGPGAAIMPCVSLGLLVVMPLVLVSLWALQRAFPSAAGWRSAAAGAAVGLVGSVVLTLHCGSPFGGHVALAHGLPIVIAALAGGLLGSKVARA